MKRITFFFCLAIALVCQPQVVSAQYYFYNSDYYDNPWLVEVGFSANAMNCLTDLGGAKGIGAKFTKDLNLGKTHLAGGVYINAVYKNKFAFRLEGTMGKVSANDNVLKSVATTDIARARYNRNLHFRSQITELALVTEIHPLFIFVDWPARDYEAPRYSPYLLAGIGYFSFNPQTQIGTRWVDLQPLSTEGQGFAEYPDRKVYKLQQISYPIGVGIRYELSPVFNTRVEFNYRFTSTDYLDDVSTNYIDPAVFSNYFRGNKLVNAITLHDRQIEKYGGPDSKRGSPLEKDGFFTFCFKLGIVLGRERIR